MTVATIEPLFTKAPVANDILAKAKAAGAVALIEVSVNKDFKLELPGSIDYTFMADAGRVEGRVIYITDEALTTDSNVFTDAFVVGDL